MNEEELKRESRNRKKEESRTSTKGAVNLTSQEKVLAVTLSTVSFLNCLICFLVFFSKGLKEFFCCLSFVVLSYFRLFIVLRLSLQLPEGQKRLRLRGKPR